jgi:hypothetical protein
MTKDILKTGKGLGEWKKEMSISEGYIVRPKFYAVRDADSEYVKIKGLGRRLNYAEFVGLLHIKNISYDKFTKFKEAIRRDFIPNEIISVNKEFSLDDEKRVWQDVFEPNRFDVSVPILVNMHKK